MEGGAHMDQPPRTWKLFFHGQPYIALPGKTCPVFVSWIVTGKPGAIISWNQTNRNRNRNGSILGNGVHQSHQRQGPLLKTARITLLINPGKLNARAASNCLLDPWRDLENIFWCKKSLSTDAVSGVEGFSRRLIT